MFTTWVQNFCSKLLFISFVHSFIYNYCLQRFHELLLKDLSSTFVWIFPTATTMSAVGKEPHFFFSFSSLFSSRGSLLDWFGQIRLYSHWSTQTWRSTNACVPATDEAVVCTLIEPSNAGAYWAMPHSDFLAWLSSAALKIFISGVSSQIPFI